MYAILKLNRKLQINLCCVVCIIRYGEMIEGSPYISYSYDYDIETNAACTLYGCVQAQHLCSVEVANVFSAQVVLDASIQKDIFSSRSLGGI